MASDDQVVYMQDELASALSPKSPAVADAVFGSAPRPRRPSTPKSPLGGSSSQLSTPAKKDKALPPVPAQAASGARAKSGATPLRARPARRPDSPDVETMIARTPRPRGKSSVTFNPPPAHGRKPSAMAIPSSWKGIKAGEKAGDGDTESIISDYGTLLKDDDSEMERMLEGEGSESDSSIDIHTPLPHLMFRDGLLSPRSKLLPGGSAPLSVYLDDDAADATRAGSVLSLASNATSTMTKSGVYRDPRDTQRRRTRHKDQALLRAGMGLTTGLGWSDSEDEDAPSMLTRRLITTSIAQRRPTLTGTRAPSQLMKSPSVGNLSHPPPSYSRAPSRALSRSTSASFSTTNRLSSAALESLTSVETAPVTRSRTQSNASASSFVSSGSRESSGPSQSVASSQTSQGRTTVPRPLRLPQTAGMQQPSAPRSTSMSDSRPPVAAKSKLIGSRPHTRTRTLSNPGARIPGGSTLPRPPSSKMVPPRSVSAAVMAPIRSRSISSSISLDRRSIVSDDVLSEFPSPPSAPASPAPGARGLIRPSVNTRVAHSASASPISPPSGMRVLNTVGTGPRPRIGTGMAYRSSGYSSFYDTSRTSRASVASSGKEVGVI
ncbi:hypothetical protein BD413DRAFT_196757 [Trametes elegans]|nr:hypothetical protein BD413DRAFT_196757 [Trametes elegans]